MYNIVNFNVIINLVIKVRFRRYKLEDCDKLNYLLNKLYQDKRVNYDNNLDSNFIVKNYY